MASNTADIPGVREQEEVSDYLQRKDTVVVNVQTLQAAQVAVKALFYILTHSKDDSLRSECKQMINTLCEKFSVRPQEAEPGSLSN